MMVETILESSQDFGMSSGPLPQWKRELLQRRAARSRPPPAAPPDPPPPPPPPPSNDDEELRYGPGIVKRLKSRYLSLALREAPRRRPSVLRRATSLEHLLDERPPPAPRPHSRPARPVSLAAPTHAALVSGPPLRRDSVKRARSVDALSRLDARDDPLPSPPQPRPRALAADRSPPRTPPPPPSPPPSLPRSARPPRRPAPLLRDTERPPPDVVRSTLRKFEPTPARRTAPAARVSAVLRGLEAPPRSSTPEPRGRSPSPAAADLSAIDDSDGAALSVEAKRVSQAALEGIARAGSTVRYTFESPERGSHLPPLAATNPVLLHRARLSASPRRVGVIKPMPAPALESSSPPPDLAPDTPGETRRPDTPPPDVAESAMMPRPERKEPPPSALVEPIPRSPPEEHEPSRVDTSSSREPTPEMDLKAEPRIVPDNPKPTAKKALMNGHVTPERTEVKAKSLKGAGIERAWSGAGAAGAARRLRPAAPAATSVVFNFSDRKEVPDYIENDGIVLRASRRNRFKAGEAGVVALRPGALGGSSESEGEEGGEEARPPSPCSVRFVNDNVLINGRSSLLARTPLHKQRAAKLKLQFDDSLTRTFEYPSETSLCEEPPARPEPPAAAPPAPLAPPAPPAQHAAALASNTHLAGGGGGLARYTPSKTRADTFQLGLSRAEQPPRPHGTPSESEGEGGALGAEAEAAEAGDARPCAAESARPWSESRTHTTDLLF